MSTAFATPHATDAAPGTAAASAPPELRRAAQEFEGVFLSQVLGDLNVSFTTPGLGGSQGESPFASMLRDEYARIMGRSGGIGGADAVMRELLHAQEVGA
jgi:Rod binding domain-containing protein